MSQPMTVRVVRNGNRYSWQKRYRHRLPTTSTTTFATFEDAMAAAEGVAMAYGVKVAQPRIMAVGRATATSGVQIDAVATEWDDLYDAWENEPGYDEASPAR